ncbi:MAG: NUDIX domain-containing protein [Ignavibacterium sp.]|nr:NUDIX domain-containing protein [Ignavibacterium sp.]
MTKKFGAGILLINSNNELLMLLRDNIPNIPFPNMWDIPGGQIEPGENPEETVKREMIEEMNLELGKIKLFKVYESEDLMDSVFWKRIDLEPDKIDLKEGQRIAYFSREELSQLKLAFNYNLVVEEFFNFISKSNE